MQSTRTVISIVGSSGRKDDAARMNRELFERMCARAERLIEQELALPWDRVTLQSGGAAWCDHVAVRLFLKHPESALMLFLPCQLQVTRMGAVSFVENNSHDWRLNPGWVINKAHVRFTKILGVDTRKEILKAHERSAMLDADSGGFLERNSRIAQCNILVAFSFGTGQVPSSSGTYDTWKKSKAERKILISLDVL